MTILPSPGGNAGNFRGNTTQKHYNDIQFLWWHFLQVARMMLQQTGLANKQNWQKEDGIIKSKGMVVRGFLKYIIWAQIVWGRIMRTDWLVFKKWWQELRSAIPCLCSWYLTPTLESSDLFHIEIEWLCLSACLLKSELCGSDHPWV